MPGKFIPIPLIKLVVDSVPDFDLYLRQNDRFVLYKKGNYKFDQETLNTLLENKVSSLFVEQSDLARFERYTRKEQIRQERSTVSTQAGKVRLALFYNELRESYHVIDKAVLLPGQVLDFPVFFRNGLELQALPDSSMDSDGKWEYKGNNGSTDIELFIGRESLPRYRALIEDSLREINRTEVSCGVELKLKAAFLRELTKMTVRDVLDDPVNSARMMSLKNVINYSIDFILQNSNAFHSLMIIQSHDFYTYIHSVNVCTLCIGLGTSIGLPLYPDLYILGLGGILHDMGKKNIDTMILNKPEPLNTEEFETIRQHVRFGAELLRGHTDIPDEAVRMVLEHHERLNGSGYPKGISGDNISMFGRIAQIVEVYDAMTTDFPYRKKYRPFDALNHLHMCSELYDPNLTREFILLLGRQFEQNGMS